MIRPSNLIINFVAIVGIAMAVLSGCCALVISLRNRSLLREILKEVRKYSPDPFSAKIQADLPMTKNPYQAP